MRSRLGRLRGSKAVSWKKCETLVTGKTVVRELREASSSLKKSFEREEWNALLTELERVACLGEQISRTELALQAQRVYELVDRRLDAVNPSSFREVEGDLEQLLGQIGHWVWTQGGPNSMWKVV